jgi:hypothetical protein
VFSLSHKPAFAFGAFARHATPRIVRTEKKRRAHWGQKTWKNFPLGVLTGHHRYEAQGMDMQLQIPDDIARVIQRWQPDLSRAILEVLALQRYRNEHLSESQVRRMLGFRTRMQVHAFLKAHNVHLNYSIQELENDLESLKGHPKTT